MTQRNDGIRTHRKLLSPDEVDDTSILKTGRPSRYRTIAMLDPAPADKPGPRLRRLSRSVLLLLSQQNY
jgi:hypothetical protein